MTPDLTTARRILSERPDLAARLLLLASEPADEPVLEPGDAYRVVAPHLLGFEDERLVCVALDRKRRVVDVATLTVGTDAFTVVDPRQVYRWALTRARTVAAVLLAHNHPSGDPTPSAADRDVTRRVANAGKVLGIALVEHIVVGGVDRWASLANEGVLPPFYADPTFTA